MRFGVVLLGALCSAPLLAAHAGESARSSLRGSRGSVERMYTYAVEKDLRFHRTSREVRDEADREGLVRLASSDNSRLVGVSFPYARPTTLLFIEQLAASYRLACGEPLVVTSALRPTTRQPRNGSPKSVHPTGLAIDIRKPGGACLGWLRQTLLRLEQQRLIEATEEFRPPHFHIAVFGDRYWSCVNASAETRLAESGATTRAATAKAVTEAKKAKAGATARGTARAATRRYVVRRGDSLWEIARRNGTTVSRLRALNGLRSSTVKPGQRLALPSRG